MNTTQNSRTNSKNRRSPITKKLKSSAKKLLDQGDTTEGEMTALVENQTGKLPSMTWLGLAVGSMAAQAVILTATQKKEYANFVGAGCSAYYLVLGGVAPPGISQSLLLTDKEA